jgi:EAL domain-containing protein (putative c-di-GMP-specific phosphodiesterase class I)
LERKLSDLLVVERIGGSLGVVEINPDEQVDSDVLLKQGLNASERAMEISNREFVTYFYDNELQKQLDREKYIGQELNRSINEDGDNLYLMYQPVVNLDTNKIHGFEALARFTTSNEEPISPNEFIPIAEKTKLINPLGKIIIQQALAFSKRLTSEGYNDITVSVNISIIQLLRHDFVSSLFEMIQEAGVDPHLIGIELTETVFVHNFDVVNRILDVIQQAGLQVAIDDFGKGYSSLARECDLNIKYLKIDKFFIDKLMHIDPESAITSDIISMAHKLGHCVIAEGVEHESQRQFLINHHCDKMQGFLFSRPVLPDKALALLKKHH